MMEYDNTDKVINDIMSKAQIGMAKAMLQLEADTKQVCPVNTGTLKRSYTSGVDVDDAENTITGWCGTNVEYAPFADFKQPHLSLMAKQDQQKIKTIINNELIK